MRFCHHIQSHRSPKQLTRLVRTIKAQSPDSGAHFGRKFDHERFPELLDLTDVHLAHANASRPGPSGLDDR